MKVSDCKQTLKKYAVKEKWEGFIYVYKWIIICQKIQTKIKSFHECMVKYLHEYMDASKFLSDLKSHCICICV